MLIHQHRYRTLISMLHNNNAQSRLPIAAIVVIGIIVLFVLYLVTRVNVNINERDVEVFILSFAIAGLAFVYMTMKGDKLKMEGV